jgi:hypothetical protein
MSVPGAYKPSGVILDHVKPLYPFEVEVVHEAEGTAVIDREAAFDDYRDFVVMLHRVVDAPRHVLASA